MRQYLFSYGTLQQPKVQHATFGRDLKGEPDTLVGYQQSWVKIKNEEVVDTSGKTHHPIVKYTGNPQDRVEGTVFEISAAELDNADAYEVDDYERISATLASGKTAWVYVDTNP